MIALLSAWAARAPQLKKTPNIGDRFIEDAVVWHLRTTGGLSGEAFPVFSARAPLDRRALATVNQSRALLLCGSNLFHRTFWPGYVKLTPKLASIRVPIIAFGVGWGGEKPREGYEYRPLARLAIRHIAASFPILSVRDEVTLELLAEQVPETRGRARLTGCPVLFRHNSGRFDAASLSGGGAGFSPKRILFSSNERLYLDEHVALFRRVRALYPEAEITVALNQRSDAFTSRMEGERFTPFRSDDPEDFYRQFERHDFQIGFRLHNHMSFLSLSKPSLTVEADGRTDGFSKTFDLENVPIREIEGLTRERVAGLLGRNADRLPVVGAKRWSDMKELIQAIVALPEPPPPGFLDRVSRIIWPPRGIERGSE